MTKAEPRRWWISGWEPNTYDLSDGSQITVFITKDNPGRQEAFPVIEYSAYESLLESLILAKKQRDEFELENVQLKLSLSYLAKVPTEPYEKEMAKKIIELEAKLKEVDEALIAIARLVRGK